MRPLILYPMPAIGCPKFSLSRDCRNSPVVHPTDAAGMPPFSAWICPSLLRFVFAPGFFDFVAFRASFATFKSLRACSKVVLAALTWIYIGSRMPSVHRRADRHGGHSLRPSTSDVLGPLMKYDFASLSAQGRLDRIGKLLACLGGRREARL